MRKNGWQPPFHPLQVVAIAVFFALVIVFYLFLLPFTGFSTIKQGALFLYTPTVCVVLVLYAWCVAINPADPGVLGSSTTCNILRRHSHETPTLYCTLCKVEILKNSRHCRSCDKCVDGFDHHCQWLNNCVGERNYRAFFGLMVCTIAMLIVMWSLGLWVMIHGFISEKGFETDVARRFGCNFPFDAYVGVVAFCTLLAMVATYPLGHLLIFHIILCQKGIHTHEFVVAMRDLEQIRATQVASDSHESVVNSGKTSPGSCSSQESWCTPPRIVFDHEEIIVQPEQFSSANDVELDSRPNGTERAKMPVKLNPWTLASLNKDDVLHSSMISVSRSSVLRPVSSRNETSSSSGSHKGNGNGNGIVSVKANVAEVQRQLSHGYTKESGGNHVNTEVIKTVSPRLIKSSGAQIVAPCSLQGDVKIAIDARSQQLIGRVSIVSSDGSGLSSRSFRIRPGQLDMLAPRTSLSGWRWRENPTFDAKWASNAENSAEVVSLPSTPTKSTSTLILHRLSM
ncbi:hypothetical protein GOP47_0011483 [Adiantum capillus-veneris]|uniref:S-acyltransferase n=1 Tax=Adiantum capillus-veneris TaxID=13818 RepID=A0A9D4USW7_ADICA|nr:hypothetical protein GOP47_0011483 [Adiantum capillus-veneris]